MRLVKPCSVKRFFDSTEHSEVELVSSTKEERDTKKREKAMKRSRQKNLLAALPGNLHVRKDN